MAVNKWMLGKLEPAGVRMDIMLAVVLRPWLTPLDSSLRHFIACTKSMDPIEVKQNNLNSLCLQVEF